jgi:hypothetical protein
MYFFIFFHKKFTAVVRQLTVRFVKLQKLTQSHGVQMQLFESTLSYRVDVTLRKEHSKLSETIVRSKQTLDFQVI